MAGARDEFCLFCVFADAATTFAGDAREPNARLLSISVVAPAAAPVDTPGGSSACIERGLNSVRR